MYLATNEHWYNWLHFLTFLDHIWIIKLLFFCFVALIYPFIWLRNRYVDAESTTWANVALFTEKIGTFIGRILFFSAIGFMLFQLIRWLLK